jgi:hypothetical protein
MDGREVSKSIQEWQAEITAWSNAQFPDRTLFGTVAKLALEEMPEFLRNRDDPLEYADMLILILDIASQQGIDVGAALEQKMAINRKRSWAMGADGLYKHTNKDDHE